MKNPSMTLPAVRRPRVFVSSTVRDNEAVFAAYGWDPRMDDGELLARLLAVNPERVPA